MSGSNNAQFAFENALKLLKDNNLNEAIEQLNEILKIHPDHIESLDLLGAVYIKLNKPNDALSIINKSIDLTKDIKKYLEMKYKLLTFKGDSKNAFECLQLLHKKYPSINTAVFIEGYFL